MDIKGTLHVHSAYSYDAKLSLGELKDVFKKEGLSFVLMTEHTDEMKKEEGERFIRECREESDESFVFIPGFEVPYKDTHTLMLGATVFSERREAEALREFKSHSSLAVLAHPHKHEFWVDDVLSNVIDGVEVWNSQYDGKYVPRQKSVSLLKELIQKNESVLAFAGLDFHRVEHAGGPTLALKVEQLSEKDILQELSVGNFRIHGRGTVLDSKGNFIKGGGPFSVACGFVSVFLVSLGKKTNALLANIGVRPPRFLRRFIRRFL